MSVVDLQELYGKRINSAIGLDAGTLITAAIARIAAEVAGGMAGTGDMTKAVYDTKNEGAIRLTPRASSTGPEGTIFYNSSDDSVYVGTE